MEDFHWEDEIDIDDSDLPSLLSNPKIPSKDPNSYNSTLPPLSLSLPPLQPCSQNPNPNPNPKNAAHRPIPGPAGAVQAAMHRKASAAVAGACSLLNSRGRLRVEEEEQDGDFKLSPWLSAAAFLGGEFELMWPISLIKDRNNARAAVRIPQVAGIVKSCVPNGLGDLFITLKDPTGIIGASIHRNVLLESNLGGDISVGCVLILKQVAVFCPGRLACYINVTANNMVKLISKDCGPPHKQMMPSSEPRYEASGKQMEFGQNQVEKQISTRNSEENIPGNELSREIDNERILDRRKRGSTESSPYNITTKNPIIASQSNFTTNISTMIAAKLNKTSPTTNVVEKPDLETNTVADVVFIPDQRVDTNKNMISTSNVKTSIVADASANMDTESDTRMKEPKKMISSVSANQWTDEQLLELFADYQDDFN
ncbi:uncharacterized protein A4U43_C04F28920 [Asparagus officinalis]|uniref:Homologous recombination OB-fold protein OB-fold domain-containing protein n=1 Tax=Asparagus officinalis TaxID=4686 RepID=A0A5P1F760_ASPOF|nr:uncharacterized protein C17orf53 [Asparagus officinalis]ONK73247.1 uncharacterized protein A4U43_C04F28920 [Asparagus officinalis]